MKWREAEITLIRHLPVRTMSNWEIQQHHRMCKLNKAKHQAVHHAVKGGGRNQSPSKWHDWQFGFGLAKRLQPAPTSRR